MALYDRIGTTYDATRRADPYLLGRLLHHLSPALDRMHLDLGCGTGNYTAALRRAGISMFADAADASEVQRGVAELDADIRSGRIAQVIRSYAHERGDYLFTVARKPSGVDR
ncbi:MAG: hypothetical protein ACREQB_06815 [Candidatus Binataceae bacterium]